MPPQELIRRPEEAQVVQLSAVAVEPTTIGALVLADGKIAVEVEGKSEAGVAVDPVPRTKNEQ